MTHMCPVCGYLNLRQPPRGEATGGSYEICPSCGFQFGVSDDDLGITYSQWRQDWIAAGMPWRSFGLERPPHWNPREQLTRIMETIMVQSE